MNIFKLIFEKKTFVRAVFVAFFVGIILNLINQGGKIIHFQYQDFDYGKMALTFLVPYLVSTYSSLMAKIHFKVGEIAPIDAYLECSCGKIIMVKKGEIIPECSTCKNKTKYKLAIRKAPEIKRVEEQLKSMALFAELNPAPVFRLDIDGKIIESNPASNHIFKRENLVNLNIKDILPNINKININEIISNDKIINITEPVDSSFYRFELKGISKLSVCQIYGADITEITKTRLENIKLLSAIEQTSNSIIITKTDGEIEFVNKAFEQISGYKKEDVLGKNPRLLKTDHLSKDVYKNMWDTIISGKVWKGEFHNKKKNGNKYWEEATISPIKDDDGNIVSFMAVKEDITQRKADKKVLQSMALFAKLNPEPVFRFDKTGLILESNPAANNTFNMETIVGNNVTELLQFAKNLDVNSFIKNSEIKTIEENIENKIFRFILRGINDLNVVQIYGSDITKRRQAEKKVRMQKESIESSITYAKRIQTAVLPQNEKINKILENYFIVFKPRDIVSGDFYWINQLDDKIYIVAADCTGHGVPGAFMSMLGVSFLNEIINKAQYSLASEILNQLRNSVKTTLSQTGKDNENKDGMDIAICVIDKKTLKMQYAGAYNPLYLYRDKELIETAADRMPIGIYIKEKDSFTNNEMQLKKDDVFYIFSDGYTDQFGGPRDRKFTKKALKELLGNICDKPMLEQKELIDSAFQNWKGNLDQTDDIVIIGVKI